MSALRELLAVFGIEVDDSEVKKADKTVDGFAEKLKGLAKTVAGVIAANEFLEFAEHTAEIGHQTEQSALKLGIGTDAVQQLGFAATQSGSNVESLTFAMLQLEDRAGDALVNATGENAKQFAKLGISVRDSSGEVKSADVLLAEVADKMAGMKSQAEKVTTAMNFFGRQGREILPFLEKGADGIAALRKEAEDLGGGFSEKAVKASVEFHESLDRLGFASLSARGKIAEVLLPALSRLVDVGTEIVATLTDVAKNSSIVETVLGTLGVAAGLLAIKMLVAFAPLLLSIAGFALLALFIEDIVTMFRGGKSVVGDFIDALFGMGSAAALVKTVRDAIADTVQFMKDGIRIMQMYQRFTSGDFKLDQKDIDAANRMNAAAAGATGGLVGSNEPIFDEEQYKKDTIRRQRREAAKNGQLYIAPGEDVGTAANALGAANTFGPELPPASVTVPRSGGGGSSYTNAPQYHVTVNGNADAQTVELIERKLQEFHETNNRETLDALEKTGEAAP